MDLQKTAQASGLIRTNENFDNSKTASASDNPEIISEQTKMENLRKFASEAAFNTGVYSEGKKHEGAEESPIQGGAIDPNVESAVEKGKSTFDPTNLEENAPTAASIAVK